MLEQIKNEVIRIGRQAQREGLCKHKAGNFSILQQQRQEEITGELIDVISGANAMAEE